MLALLAYTGGYMTVYGMHQYVLYSGTERDFDSMSASELQPKLNVRGSIETVTYLLHSENITTDILGFPIGEETQYYYVLPIGYESDREKQRYCAIAVSNPEDIAAVEELMKSAPAPHDPNAPRFEFRGIVMYMSDAVYGKLKSYLQVQYGTEYDIVFPTNVSDKLVPYVIHVKGKNGGSYIIPIAIGGACFVIGAGGFVLLAVLTYRKKHRYD